MGPQLQFSKIIKLANNYYEYLYLDRYKEMTRQHKINTNTPHNRHLHFGCESEILLHHHISKVLDKSEYFIGKNLAEIRRE